MQSSSCLLPPPKGSWFYLIISIIVSFLLGSCRTQVREVDPAFGKYIESYTTGTISRQSVIRIRLSAEMPTVHADGEPVAGKLFSFDPEIEGKAFWVDSRTIEFRPGKNLAPGRMYDAVFNLAGVAEVPGEYKDFPFQFKVISPSFEVEENGLRITGRTSPGYMELTGRVLTADFEEPAEIEKVLSADYGGRSLSLEWTHDIGSKTSVFVIDSIPRGQDARQLVLRWDGKPLAAGLKGEKRIEVPARDEFKVIGIRAVNRPEQYLLVQFSQLLSAGQDLQGLLGVDGLSDLRFTVEGSQVKVYAPDAYLGDYQVRVHEGIESTDGMRLENSFAGNIFFEDRMPSVAIRGRGNILPQAGKLVLPFEAVNLKAVDVTIVKIYENNIPQFLQENDLGGDYDLRRVAGPVVRKTVRLDSDQSLNLTRKNRFSLDIDELIRTEPGAIYRITIGFRRSYALFDCARDAAEKEPEGYSYGDDPDGESDFWSLYDSYYPYGFDWNERDNPCHDSYYNKQRWASRNVIASNLGLIAKRGADGSMFVSVTDLLSAGPVKGADIELLDYQQQVLYRGKSDGEGMARFQLDRKPFLLIARQGEQRGYLKLDDGSSLPLSRFDVGGDQVQEGLKGFIYGERGVWRPGDSLFVTFLLEDRKKALPAGHPVVFEVYNPRGQLYKRMVRTQSVDGFYTFPFATREDDPTGNWTARVKAGGAVFSKELKIETIMPNRLKIDLAFGGREELSAGDDIPVQLTSRWLFGGTARNLKARVDAFLSRRTTGFSDYKGFAFDDPVSSFSSEVKTVFDGSLDGEGRASFLPRFTAEQAVPGMLNANFLVKVFEPGGNFSIDQVSMPYHVYASYAGVKVPEGEGWSGVLLTDRDHPVEIVNVDTRGRLVRGGRVRVELYKVQWRWWWDEQGDEFSNFNQDKYNKLIQSEELTLASGRGKWDLRIDYPEWGRYLVRVTDLKSGHVTGQTVYIDWPGWNQRMKDDHPEEAAMLSFTANKEKFRVGEEVTLTIPSSGEGRCLISIETGSRVLKSFWAATEEGQTTVQFTAEKEMAPNVYVTVSLLQPHSHTGNDLPIRMYGTIPVLVEAPETLLKPVITMQETLAPEEEASVTVSEASGEAMTYTLAIVDEGLLDLTRYRTPDPHGIFYAREALGVKTWDLFDAVVGAWGADLERILSIGGDGDLDRGAAAPRANRFKPVVEFMGPFTLEKGKKQSHSFRLDPYIGSVRVMVVAGHDGAYGAASKAVAVKKPLMLLATLPRVLAPGERIRLPVTVFATEKSLSSVDVRVSANEFLQPATKGGAARPVHFGQPGEQLVYFDMNVGQRTGVGKIRVEAVSGDEKAFYEVEIDVRNPNPYITNVLSEEIPPGKTWETSFLPAGEAGTNEGYLEISSIPSLNLGKRLNYLIRYPHGCVEQITSSVFPQLVLDQLTDLSGQEKAALERNVRAGINRLRGFQLADGGLGYWAGAARSDEWGTSYAGHFMLEARERGYSLPPGFLSQWTKYQRNKAVSWTPGSADLYGGDLSQAYRLYLLAAAGAPEMGAMNRLREFRYLSPAAGWLLAAAYHVAGQPEAASQLVSRLPLETKSYERPGSTYGSALRDKAIILQTLVLMDRREQAGALLTEVARSMSEDRWYSTQTTAWSLIAVAEYCGKNASGEKLQVSYKLNNGSGELNSPSYVARIPLKLGKGRHAASVSNKGENTLFVRWILSGQPAPGEDLPLPASSGKLEMTVKYKTLAGEALNPVRLAQGTDFIAEVTVHNPGGDGDYEQLALSQIFPSGWEIINTRLASDDNVLLSSPFDYQDIRDDRVYTYFSLGAERSVTYHVMLNAAYLGRFFQPGVYCEAMYDAGIQAHTSGRWVEVKRPDDI